MKKTIITSVLGISFMALNAQVEVTSKNFDLESQNKHKSWFIKGANTDKETGKTYINFVKGQCDVSTTSDASFIYTNYKGVKYNVEKLIFDKDFNYLETVSKKYESTAEAILDNIPIFGKKFNIPYDPFFPYQIDNTYMFTTVVTYGYTAGKDIVSSYVGLKLRGSESMGLNYCDDIVKRYGESGAANRQSKGEKWYPIYSNPVPNGGNILYSTVGVLKEDKQHYVFRKFDKDLNLLKEQTFTFDYQCLITAKSIEKAPGIYDYVFISMPLNGKSKAKTVAPYNYEYFYIDGETYEIKEQVKFTAPNTRWFIDQVIRNNNSTYIIGGCADNNKEYTDVKGSGDDDFQNLQVAKFENGNLVYIKSHLNKDLVASLKTSKEFESNSKVSSRMVGTTLNVSNNKLIYQGRSFKGGTSGFAVVGQPIGGASYLGLQAFVLNEDGGIDAVLSSKGENLGSSVSFSNDGKKLHWFSYDMEKYNKFKDGVMYANKSKFLINSLAVISYDFDAKNISKFQNLENEEWAISHNNPFLMEDENKIIMLGYKITKKAKESEVVFITIKK